MSTSGTPAARKGTRAAKLPPLPAFEPWKWTREDVWDRLTDRQRDYIEILEATFRVKNARGVVMPYKAQPWQIWFHAHSSNAMRDPPDRIVEKGRGLGLTTMTAMDLLIYCATHPRVTIPVASSQLGSSDEFVKKSFDLVNDAEEDIFGLRPGITSFVEMQNGSREIPIASGNPRSIRGLRAPLVAIDEFAFHERAQELWKAIRPVLSEGGQLTVCSTHDGTGTLFYDMVQKARAGETEMMHFYLPLHEVDVFDRHRRVSEQVAEGTLHVIAPWVDLNVLDRTLQEDPVGYLQENLAEVMDEALSVLPRSVVDSVIEQNPLWEIPVIDEELSFHAATLAQRPANNNSPVYVGVDFASTGDLAAYTAWEDTASPSNPDGPLVQRWLCVLQGVGTPAQNKLIRLLDIALRPDVINIDMTGPGTGLYEHAANDLKRTRVNGIHFASKDFVEMNKVSIKKILALNMEQLFRMKQVRIAPGQRHSSLQYRHLTAVRRADLDAPRKDKDGHGDIFWANALALHAAKRALNPNGPVVTTKDRMLPSMVDLFNGRPTTDRHYTEPLAVQNLTEEQIVAKRGEEKIRMMNALRAKGQGRIFW